MQKEEGLVLALYKEGLLPLVLVSLISSDNVFTVKSIAKTKEQLEFFKKELEELSTEDIPEKAEYLDRIENCFDILTEELKKSKEC